jgi:hypothetical protein
MKWIWILVSIVVIGVVIGLWQSGALEKTLGAGLVERFLAPWKAWAKWIGYFE